MNSSFFTFFKTSKSLNDLMKDEPDFPPVASQAQAPAIELMKSSREMLFFLLRISNQLGKRRTKSILTPEFYFFILLKTSYFFSCISNKPDNLLTSQFSIIVCSDSTYFDSLIISSLEKVNYSRQSLCYLELRAAAMIV